MNENLISIGSLSDSTNDEKSENNSRGDEINKNKKEEILKNKAIIKEINEILKQGKQSKKKEENASEEILNYIKQNNINILEVKENDNSTIIQIYCANKEDYNLRCMFLCLDKLYQNQDITQYLLNEDSSKMNIFEISCEVGEIKIFRILKNYIKNNQIILNYLINNGMNGKRNIFHIAADKNKCISLLFFYSFYFHNDNISILNLKNKSTWSPLHIACYRRHYKFCQYLISLGVDIDIRDSDNKTPLFYAVQSNSLRIVKLLILNGANKKIKDIRGKTAIEYTQDENIYDILEDKNIFKLVCKCETQYQSLKKHYRNVFMLILLFLMIIIQSFIIIKYRLNNFIQKCCGDLSTSLELTFLIIDIIFEIFCVCIYFFLKILKKNKEKKNNSNIDHSKFCLKENGIEYYEMFKYNENICVKCQRVKEISTQHCISCDMCIDNFDHHCYFLNTCIYSKNKKYFRIFLFEGLSTVLFNLFTSILFFRDFNICPNIYYGIIYNENEFEQNKIFNFIIYALNTLYCALALFFIFASIIPFIFGLITKKAKTCCVKSNKRKIIINLDNKQNELLLPTVESNENKNNF